MTVIPLWCPYCGRYTGRFDASYYESPRCQCGVEFAVRVPDSLRPPRGPKVNTLEDRNVSDSRARPFERMRQRRTIDVPDGSLEVKTG
jgi:hypothetical protein